MKKKMLLISSSKFRGGGYLDHYDKTIPHFLLGVKEIVFIPYSAHKKNWEAYTQQVKDRFALWGIKVLNVNDLNLYSALLNGDVRAIFVGGGNTFRLLKNLQFFGLVEAIQKAFMSGGGLEYYMGASAGSNVAGWGIHTTNDMPIVYPEHGLEGLRLKNIQINPHYFDPDEKSLHMGETRPQRIAEFHEESVIPVIGLREGSYLFFDEGLHQHGEMFLGGKETGAKFFFHGKEPIDIPYPCLFKLNHETVTICK